MQGEDSTREKSIPKGRVLQEGRAPCDVRVLLHPATRGLQPRVPGRAKIPLCEVQC